MRDYNNKILEEMKSYINNINGVYEIQEYCRNTNKTANEEYIKQYPTHKDLLQIFETAVSIIETSIINNCNLYLVENILTDIEFIIGQNVLTESHIQRLLLSTVTLCEMSIFKKKVEPFKDKLNNLYECDSNRFVYEYSEYKALLPFNYNEVNSYLRYNKIGYEEELVNNELNGDYITESYWQETNEKISKSIHEMVLEEYSNIKPINEIDKFKLEQHGFGPINESGNLFVHSKKGNQYNIYKYKQNEYFLITENNKELKSYKLTLHEKKLPDYDIASLFDLSNKLNLR